MTKEDSFRKSRGSKEKAIIITLEQRCDVIDGHEREQRNSKMGREVKMPESTVRNVMKHAEEIKVRGKVASAFRGLQISTSYKSFTMIEIECLLALWIEDYNKKHTASASIYMKIKKKERKQFSLLC
jgi:hypothetical protein